jgi:hypothetical protein
VSPEAKIANVEAQINACYRGATNVITCPYCGVATDQTANALCCADMGLTVRAILRKEAQQECLDVAARIADNLARN